MTSDSHDLTDFLTSAAIQMGLDYQYIQKRAGEDPGTAGDQGEEQWAALLRGWLPAAYHVVTKGRIVGTQGMASRQVDIIVLHPSYPPNLRARKLYLAAGVVAAFECKITLEADHIIQAMENAAQIKRQSTSPLAGYYGELNSSILYGLLTHSHSWKASCPAGHTCR